MTGQVVVKQVKGPSILQRDRYRSPFLFTAIPDSTRVAQNGTAEKTLRVRPRLFQEPIVRRLLRCGCVGTAALLLVARVGAQSSAVETPEANPGRPTVSTPATLTPVGYLQFENGGLYAEPHLSSQRYLALTRPPRSLLHPVFSSWPYRPHLRMQVELPEMLSQAVAPARSSPDF